MIAPTVLKAESVALGLHSSGACERFPYGQRIKPLGSSISANRRAVRSSGPAGDSMFSVRLGKAKGEGCSYLDGFVRDDVKHAFLREPNTIREAAEPSERSDAGLLILPRCSTSSRPTIRSDQFACFPWLSPRCSIPQWLARKRDSYRIRDHNGTMIPVCNCFSSWKSTRLSTDGKPPRSSENTGKPPPERLSSAPALRNVLTAITSLKLSCRNGSLL
jgi:hypothetical protein